MNERNVEALTECLMDCLGVLGIPVAGLVPASRTLAELLAEGGCLGPATKVLTEDHRQVSADGLDLPAYLERIAKGEV